MSSGDQQTRPRILKAAAKLLTESEGNTVRMQDIAKEAKLSRQALYLHFNSRVELLLALNGYLAEQSGFFERIEKIMVMEPITTALDEFLEVWVLELLPAAQRIARALLTSQPTDEAATTMWSDRMELIHSRCRNLVNRLDEAQLLSNLWSQADAADWLWMLISVQSWESLVIERGWSKEKYLDHLKQIVRQTLIEE